jgi:hypothetical protein
MPHTVKASNNRFSFRTTFPPPVVNTNFTCRLQSAQCRFVKPGNNHVRCKNRVVFGADLCWQHTRLKLHVAIFQSRIPHAGNGLFAFDFDKRQAGDPVFLPGAIICHYNGEPIDAAEVQQRYGEATAPYVVQTSDDHSFADAACRRGIGSLPNHTTTLKDRNAVLYYDDVLGATVVKAFKKLYHGDEILINYDSKGDEATRLANSVNAPQILLYDIKPGTGVNAKKWKATVLTDADQPAERYVPWAYLNESAKLNALINFPTKVPPAYKNNPATQAALKQAYEVHNDAVVSKTTPTPKAKPAPPLNAHGGDFPSFTHYAYNTNQTRTRRRRV